MDFRGKVFHSFQATYNSIGMISDRERGSLRMGNTESHCATIDSVVKCGTQIFGDIPKDNAEFSGEISSDADFVNLHAGFTIDIDDSNEGFDLPKVCELPLIFANLLVGSSY